MGPRLRLTTLLAGVAAGLAACPSVADDADALLGRAALSPAVRAVIDDKGHDRGAGQGKAIAPQDETGGAVSGKATPGGTPPPVTPSGTGAGAASGGRKTADQLLAEIKGKVEAALDGLPADAPLPTVEALKAQVDPARLKEIEARIHQIVLDRLRQPDAAVRAQAPGTGSRARADIDKARTDTPGAVVPAAVVADVQAKVADELKRLIPPLPLPQPAKPPVAGPERPEGPDAPEARRGRPDAVLPPVPDPRRLTPDVARPAVAGPDTDTDTPRPDVVAPGRGKLAPDVAGLDKDRLRPDVVAPDRGRPAPDVAGLDKDRLSPDVVAPDRGRVAPDVAGLDKDKLSPDVAAPDRGRVAPDVAGLDKDKLSPDIVAPDRGRVAPGVAGLDRDRLRPDVVAPDRRKLAPDIAGLDKDRLRPDVVAPDRGKLAPDIAGLDKDRLSPDVVAPDRGKLAPDIAGLDKDRLRPDVVAPDRGKLAPDIAGLDKDRLAPNVVAPDRSKLAPDIAGLDKDRLSPDVVAPDRGKLAPDIAGLDRDRLAPNVVAPDRSKLAPDTTGLDKDRLRPDVVAPKVVPPDLPAGIVPDITRAKVAPPVIPTDLVKLPDILQPGRLKPGLPAMSKIDVRVSVPEDLVKQSLDDAADRVKREVSAAMDGLAGVLSEESETHATNQKAYEDQAAAAEAARPEKVYQGKNLGILGLIVDPSNTKACVGDNWHNLGPITWTDDDLAQGRVRCADPGTFQTVQSKTDQAKVDADVAAKQGKARDEADQAQLFGAGAADIANRKADVLATIDQGFAAMADGVTAGTVSYEVSRTVAVQQPPAALAAAPPLLGASAPYADPGDATPARDTAAADPHFFTGPRLAAGYAAEALQVLEVLGTLSNAVQNGVAGTAVTAAIGSGSLAETDIGTVGRRRAAHIGNVTQSDSFTTVLAASIGVNTVARTEVGTMDADVSGTLTRSLTVGTLIAAAIGSNTAAGIEVGALQGSFSSGDRRANVPSATAAAIGSGIPYGADYAASVRVASTGPDSEIMGRHSLKYQGPGSMVATSIGVDSLAAISAGNVDGRALSSLDMDVGHGVVVAAALGYHSRVVTNIGTVANGATLWSPARMKVRTGDIVSFALGAGTEANVDIGVVDATVRGALEMDVRTGSVNTGTVGLNTEATVGIGLVRGDIGGKADINVSTGDISTFAIGIGNAGGVYSGTYVGSVLETVGGDVSINVHTGSIFNLGFGLVLDLGPLGTIRLTRNGCVNIGTYGSGC